MECLTYFFHHGAPSISPKLETGPCLLSEGSKVIKLQMDFMWPGNGQGRYATQEQLTFPGNCAQTFITLTQVKKMPHQVIRTFKSTLPSLTGVRRTQKQEALGHIDIYIDKRKKRLCLNEATRSVTKPPKSCKKHQ